MTYPMILSLQGKQRYPDQEPEIIELVTEGQMEFLDGGWNITYAESDLTGLAGVMTTFRVEPEKVTLIRTGKLRSTMEFQVGTSHDSLYQMEFGALMISVCAQRVMADICHDGGMIDLVYAIELEQSAAGTIDYHLDIRAK